jgi:hypothetical protein
MTCLLRQRTILIPRCMSKHDAPLGGLCDSKIVINNPFIGSKPPLCVIALAKVYIGYFSRQQPHRQSVCEQAILHDVKQHGEQLHYPGYHLRYLLSNRLSQVLLDISCKVYVCTVYLSMHAPTTDFLHRPFPSFSQHPIAIS